MNLTYWLRKTPQPTTVLADDQRIEVPRNGRSWRDLTATIKALDPSKLTCLDGQGKVIRSIVLESEEAENDKPAPSPEISDLQFLAKLLAEAYDKASSKMQPIVDSAMAFVERGGQRLAKAEADNDRLRAHIAKLNLQISDLSMTPVAADSGEQSLMGAIVAGALQAGVQQQHPKPAAVSPIKGAKK